MNKIYVSSDPSLGTRTVNLPIIGKVKIIDGIFECPEDDFEELSSLDIGCKLKQVPGPGEDKGKKAEEERLQKEKEENERLEKVAAEERKRKEKEAAEKKAVEEAEAEKKAEEEAKATEEVKAKEEEEKKGEGSPEVPDASKDVDHDNSDKVKKEDENEGGSDDIDYAEMLVKDLDKIINDMLSKELCTQEEYDEIMKKNKPDKVGFIEKKLN